MIKCKNCGCICWYFEAVKRWVSAENKLLQCPVCESTDLEEYKEDNDNGDTV